MFLAAGLSAESYVVLGKVTASKTAAAIYAATAFATSIILWYLLPLIVRRIGRPSGST